MAYSLFLWRRWIPATTAPQTDSAEYCEGDFLTEQRIQSKITTVVLAIFFVSLLGVGMGQTAVYTLGIPYIDDNVASRESPLYFGKLSRRLVDYHSCSLFLFLQICHHLISRIYLSFSWKQLDLTVRLFR